jgi:general secretion pathway protein G
VIDSDGDDHMRNKHSTGGFTLIELMIVVIIIAALAGMVLPKLLPATDAAKRNIAKMDIQSVSQALKLYYMFNNNHYPTSLDVLLNASTGSSSWKEPFLEKPAIDPWGRKYEYKCPGTHNTTGFDLWSDGPDPQQSNDDITNWSQE